MVVDHAAVNLDPESSSARVATCLPLSRRARGVIATADSGAAHERGARRSDLVVDATSSGDASACGSRRRRRQVSVIGNGTSRDLSSEVGPFWRAEAGPFSRAPKAER